MQTVRTSYVQVAVVIRRLLFVQLPVSAYSRWTGMSTLPRDPSIVPPHRSLDKPVTDMESPPTTSKKESGRQARIRRMKEPPVSLGKLTIQFFSNGTSEVEADGCGTVSLGGMDRALHNCYNAISEAQRKARVEHKYGRR